MTTNNAINLSTAGVVYFDGVYTFTGVAIGSTSALVGTGGIPAALDLSQSGNATNGIIYYTTALSTPGTVATELVAGSGFSISFSTNPNTITFGLATLGTLIDNAFLFSSNPGQLQSSSGDQVTTNGFIGINGGGGLINPPETNINIGGLNVVNGNGSITVNMNGGVFTWVVVTPPSAISISIGFGYYVQKSGSNAVVFTIPSGAQTVGSAFRVAGYNWSISPNSVPIQYGVLEAVTRLSTDSSGGSVYCVFTSSGSWSVITSLGNILAI